MNFSVKIKDYQIIKDIELEFIPGLNVIVGPSNNGKSSILKAIKSCIYTIPGSNSIRFGKNNYVVEIKFNEHTVMLNKGLKESFYIVDGDKYSKYGTNTPDAVSNALGIKELVLNGNKEILNFWDQMNYPFLIDRTSVELFRFIVDSGDNDQLSAALKDMVSDRQSINKKIISLQGSIEVVDKDINTCKVALENSKELYNSSINIIKLKPRVDRFRKLKDIYTNLLTLNKQYNTCLNNYELISTRYNKMKLIYERLNNFIFNKSKYLIILNRLNKINVDLDELNSKINKAKVLSNIIKVDTSKLIFLKDKFNLIKNIDERLGSIKIKPSCNLNISDDNLVKIIKLKKMCDNLILIQNKLYDIKNSLELSKNKSIMVDNYLKLFNTCPYCGSTIEGGKVLCSLKN